MPFQRRRKFGPKKRPGVVKPATDEYIRHMAGMAGTKGKLLKTLMKEKKQRIAKLAGGRQDLGYA